MHDLSTARGQNKQTLLFGNSTVQQSRQVVLGTQSLLGLVFIEYCSEHEQDTLSPTS